MQFGLDKKTVEIPWNMTSISPEGNLVFFTDDRLFYEYVNGTARRYYDPSLGLLTYNGRDFIRTDATSFVRDGTEFTVYLPTENKFIRRPALAGDSSFTEHNFAAEGIWKSVHSSEETLFGHKEHVSNSVTLAGELLLTRQNGEIFVRRGTDIAPLSFGPNHSQSELLRLDIERTHGAPPHVVTLFFEIKTTQGAHRWLNHFRQAHVAARKAASEASPLIRNYNTVFYNGEDDLKERVLKLREVVDILNNIYVSDLPESNNGRLWEPDIGNISNQLLNQLHFEFENFGERFKATNHDERLKIADAYGPFCKLNDCIHAAEGALANRDRSMEQAWWALHCSFLPDFYGILEDSIYDEFTLDWEFGTIFMGYHTLGKDILAAFWNNDLDLFRRDEIRPQRISSSEIFVFLGPRSTGHMAGLNEWWRNNDLDQFGYRMGDPRNAIGYIPIGSLRTHGRTETEIKTALKGCHEILNVSLVQV